MVIHRNFKLGWTRQLVDNFKAFEKLRSQCRLQLVFFVVDLSVSETNLSYQSATKRFVEQLHMPSSKDQLIRSNLWVWQPPSRHKLEPCNRLVFARQPHLLVVETEDPRPLELLPWGSRPTARSGSLANYGCRRMHTLWYELSNKSPSTAPRNNGYSSKGVRSIRVSNSWLNISRPIK